MTTRRIRAGLYAVYTIDTDGADRVWTVEQRREDPAYGNDWLWFATCDSTGAALDPLPTLRDVKHALT